MVERMEAVLVDDVLRMGVAHRNPKTKLVHHSDHGGQYHSLLLDKTMRNHGMVQSMEAISSPWDNAVTESLMSMIKMECFHRQTFETREEVKLEIFDYIECFYNRLRIHSGIGYMSPVEYEAKMLGESSRT